MENDQQRSPGVGACGTPGCYCQAPGGWPRDLLCPDCRDEPEYPGATVRTSRCVCPPASERRGAGGGLTNVNPFSERAVPVNPSLVIETVSRGTGMTRSALGAFAARVRAQG